MLLLDVDPDMVFVRTRRGSSHGLRRGKEKTLSVCIDADGGV